MTLQRKKLLVLLAALLTVPLLLFALQALLGKVRSEDEYRLEAQRLMNANEMPALQTLAEEWQRIYPQSPTAPLARADALAGTGKLEPAAKLYEQILKNAPQQPDVWARFGAALFNLGRYPEAMTACRNALQLDPTQEKAMMCLGLAAGFSGLSAELTTAQQSLAARNPGLASELRRVILQHACPRQAAQLGAAWCAQPMGGR